MCLRFASKQAAGSAMQESAVAIGCSHQPQQSAAGTFCRSLRQKRAAVTTPSSLCRTTPSQHPHNPRTSLQQATANDLYRSAAYLVLDRRGLSVNAKRSSPSGARNGPGHSPGQSLRHQHGHSHGHHAGASPAGAFKWSVLLNTLLTSLQLVIGLSFGSLALVGDALHNLGDVIGLTLGCGAERLSQRPAKGRFTFGYGRSTHMASLANVLLILVAGGVVVVEGVERLYAPVLLHPAPVAWAAAAGVVINLLSARLFGQHHHHDLNQRAAVLHLLTDAAVSVAVLISTLLVGLTQWAWLDPLTAIAVGLVVMISAVSLLREAIAVSLDVAPRGTDLVAIRAALLELPDVVDVRDLHAWGVSTSRLALTAHVVRLEQAPTDDGHALLVEARRRLRALGIRQSTLQLEVSHEDCPASP